MERTIVPGLMDNTGRVEYIDNAKGILIALVVMGHILLMTRLTDAGGIAAWIFRVIYSFHMPAFFFISGMLFNKEKWMSCPFGSFVKSRFMKLMVPYFFFEIIGTVMHQVFTFDKGEPIRTILWRIFTTNGYVVADWFLAAYFAASIGVWICLKTGRKWIAFLSCAVFLLIPQIMRNSYPGMPVRYLVRFGLCYSLVMTGYCLRKLFVPGKNPWSIPVCIAGLTISCVCNRSVENVSVIGAETGNVFLFLLGSICGTCLVLHLGNLIHFRPLAWIGENSIVILGMHQTVEWVWAYWIGLHSSFILLPFYFAVIFGVSCLFIPILKSVCPLLIGQNSRCLNEKT